MEMSFEPTTTINIQSMCDYCHISMNPPSSDEEIILTQRHCKAEATESDYETDNLKSDITGLQKV